MWPFALSGRLRIIALVGRYPANRLMRRRPIHVHTLGCFDKRKMPPSYLSGFSSRFRLLSRVHGQVAYVLLTRSPLTCGKQALLKSVRLACIRHAASVHPEPGSNSPFDFCSTLFALFFLFVIQFFCLLGEIDVYSVWFSKTDAPKCLIIIPNLSYSCQSFFHFFSFFSYFVMKASIINESSERRERKENFHINFRFDKIYL